MKYYLLKYSLYASIGGYSDDLDIVNITYDRNDLIRYMQDILSDNRIESVNDIPLNEFEFDEDYNLWQISYKVDGMCMRDECLYRIIKRE